MLDNELLVHYIKKIKGTIYNIDIIEIDESDKSFYYVDYYINKENVRQRRTIQINKYYYHNTIGNIKNK